MDALDGVITEATIILALCVAIIMEIVRRLCEFRWPSLSKGTPPTREQMAWEKLILPTLPVVICAVFCLLAKPAHFHYPEVAAKSVLSRVLYGIGTGWFSAWGYRALMFFLQRKWNVAPPGESVRPAATKEASKPVDVPAAPPPPPPEVKP
jgi:hypothetical protein